MLYTNLKLLREANACSSGMGTLIASLPKTQTEAKQISLAHILKSNGLEHAIWAMRATTEPCKKTIVLLAVDFAMESLTNFEIAFPDDNRPREALQAASDFMDGKITLAQLENKRSAARSAARSADSAAYFAYSAARSAAYSADSAAYFAYSAAYSAACSAARSAARSADSAYSAAYSAARSAAYSAARSADSAYSAAYSAARERQNELFLKRVSQ